MTFKEQLKYAREQQKREQQWSAKQAQKQMDFQERMSSTAHQREMADLQAAGLNPVLTATGGSGASAPSGAMADTSSLVNSISTMAMAAQQSAKAAHTAVKKIKKNEDPPVSPPNTGLQNLDFTEAVKPLYDFGNEHLNSIYEHLGEKPSGIVPGWTIGDMMIAGAETIGLASDAGEIVGNALVDSAVKASNKDWDSIPDKEKEIVTKYLSRHFDELDPRRSWFGTYERRGINMIEAHNAKQASTLRVKDLQLRNSLDDAGLALKKMGFNKTYITSKKAIKKYHNRYHAKRSP